MAKTGADLDRRNLFNFCRLKGAVEDWFNTSKKANRMSLKNGKKINIK